MVNPMFNLKMSKKMKKFWSLMLVALVTLGAAACTETEESVEKSQEAGLSFSAEIAVDTRAVTEKGEDNVWKTTWTEGDTLMVGEYEFTFDGKKFTCNAEGVNSIVGQEVTITGENGGSEDGSEAYKIAAKSVTFEKDMIVTLESALSFFYFEYNGSVAFNASEDIFKLMGEMQDTVEFASVSGKHLFAFYPTGNETTLSYSIGGVKVKETTINFAAGKVYNLGTLTEAESLPQDLVLSVVGTFQGWNATNGIAMVAGNNWYTAQGVELFKDDLFKIVKDNAWDVSYGGNGGVLSAETDTEYTLASDNSQNIVPTKNGKFDIYFNPETLAFKYECVEEYTNLTVDITVDNKANWSPLYIYLESNGTAVTPAEGALVTDNKYTVSGDYIGSTLSCKFISGSKVSDVQNVSVTKNGAIVTLEEDVIKLTVTLDTDNSKQWWGDTMKIHVWGTDTSFDTSWPGNTMTNEGNYTWSIIIPSELVGKTIKYLVHNGNGWQSADSTVTISATGASVTGSSIGIN